MKEKQNAWDLLEDPKKFSEAYEAREKFFLSGENQFHLDVDLKNDHRFECNFHIQLFYQS